MVTVLDEDEDLSGYEVKRCTASGAIHDSRMVEVIRGKKKLAVQVADCPLKPLEKRDEEDWGHYADWYTKYVKRDEYLLPSMATRSPLTCAKNRCWRGKTSSRIFFTRAAVFVYQILQN